MSMLLLTRVVNTSLDDIIHGEAAGGRLSPQLGIDLLGQHLQQMTRRSVFIQSHAVFYEVSQHNDNNKDTLVGVLRVSVH